MRDLNPDWPLRNTETIALLMNQEDKRLCLQIVEEKK
jgi:hypothetical protein